MPASRIIALRADRQGMIVDLRTQTDPQRLLVIAIAGARERKARVPKQNVIADVYARACFYALIPPKPR
jgi:hypothetical protein